MLGPTKPIARSTSSHGMASSLPGDLRRRLPAATSSTRTASSAGDARRRRRRGARVMTAKSRSPPSSCETTCGRRAATAATGSLGTRSRAGFGMSSSCVTLTRALAERRADAVRAGVAAADDDDVLARREDRRRAVDVASARRRAGSAATRNSIAKCTPSSSRPGIGRSRGLRAPPASTTASKSCAQLLAARRRRRTCDAGAEGRRPRRASARGAGRGSPSPS